MEQTHQRTWHLPILRRGFATTVRFLACVLLVLSGWGWSGLSGFLVNPARAGLAVVALTGIVAVVIFELELSSLRRGSTPIGSQNLQLGVLLFLSLFLLWFLPFADRRKLLTFEREYCRYLGLLLFGIGVGVRLFALETLGKYFSAYVILQPNHKLVRHGIYGSIRHPLYLSLLLAPTGIALVFASKLVLPILILGAVFVFDRIRREEHLLTVRFGAEFEQYRRRTWMLIPFVL